MEAFGQDAADCMFNNDAKELSLIIDKLSKHVQDQLQDIAHVVDVIFKWVSVVISQSTNTPLIIKLYDFLANLFSELMATGYQLWDHEAYVIVLMFCEKSGNNNALVKNKIKTLIRACFPMYDHVKCATLIIDFISASKNLKSIAECLEEIACLVEKQGTQSISEKQIRMIAKLLEHSDSGVRKGAY